MKKESSKKQQGTFGELKVAAEAIKHGCQVYFPFGDNSKTDLVIETPNHTLHRVQVKTLSREKVRYKSGGEAQTHVNFTKESSHYSYRYDSKMFDWFAIVDLEEGKIAWINSSHLDDDKNHMYLRHTPPTLNRTKMKFHMFSDYEKFPFTE